MGNPQFWAKARTNKRDGASIIMTVPYVFCKVVGIERGDHIRLQLLEIVKKGDEMKMYER